MANTLNIKPIKINANNRRYSYNKVKSNIKLEDVDYDTIEDTFNKPDNILEEITSFLLSLEAFSFSSVLTRNKFVINKARMKDNLLRAETNCGFFYLSKNGLFSPYELVYYESNLKTKYSKDAFDKLCELGVSMDDLASDCWIDSKITSIFSNASTKILSVELNSSGKLEILTLDGKYIYDDGKIISYEDKDGNIIAADNLKDFKDTYKAKSLTILKHGYIGADDGTYTYYANGANLSQGYVAYSLFEVNSTGILFSSVEDFNFYNSISESLGNNVKFVTKNKDENFWVGINNLDYVYSAVDKSLLSISDKNNKLIFNNDSCEINGQQYPRDCIEQLLNFDVPFEKVANIERRNDSLIRVEDGDYTYDYYTWAQSITVYYKGLKIYKGISVIESLPKPYIYDIGYFKLTNNNNTYISKDASYSGKMFYSTFYGKDVFMPAAKLNINSKGDFEFVPYTKEELDKYKLKVDRLGFDISKRMINYPDTFKSKTIDNENVFANILDFGTKNSDTSLWQGLAVDGSTVYLNIDIIDSDTGYPYILDSFTHELGHIYDYQGNPDSSANFFTNSSEWKNIYDIVCKNDSSHQFVRDYSVSNPSELFAEVTAELFADTSSDPLFNPNDLKMLKINYNSENGKYYESMYDYMTDFYQMNN